MKQERNSREAPPVSSDFEFSVSNYSMMSADELFFKGHQKVEGFSGLKRTHTGSKKVDKNVGYMEENG
ncbi:hypothetical protein F3Y22_tig00111837pilonHSYRG00714 [Hibiscus syriacus]|uniref:Uncharacterized protein n=1 Tax=Hibiscus syriacus TaxID=106335 RepID=A0A6A2Y7K8_HIBSY|nr:hypothetical protein F3Y22_tig00111837pilonHSYRG00714 [Hibiscus syriacus]